MGTLEIGKNLCLIVTLFVLKNVIFTPSVLSKTRDGDSKIIETILDKADKTYRSKTSHTELQIRIETENWERTMALEIWTKGMKKTLITIKGPKKDAGITTLRTGKSMWNYFPKINKVIKVPPSMMMGSWMGSDFTNDDLVKESTFIDDYDAVLKDGELKTKYYISLSPKDGLASVWGKVDLIIDKKTSIIEEQSNFNERGEKVRTMIFSKVKMMGGKNIPTVMEIISHKKNGNKTTIKYVSANFDKPVKDSFFSRRNLQKKR